MSDHISILDGPAEPHAMQMEQFCEACQTTHSLKRGCQCARCGCGMHPLFICCVSGNNGEKLAWCPICDDMLHRSQDPHVGDRFIGLDGVTMTEIKAVLPLEDAGLGPGHDRCVHYTNTGTGDHVHETFIGIYMMQARRAVGGGHTFHAVEDDEE
jgi:hypothetical protein